jgi:hypothetical protein
VIFEQILEVLNVISPSVAPFETICKTCDFSNLRPLPDSFDYFCNTYKIIREVSQELSIQCIITELNGNVQNCFLKGFWIEVVIRLSTFNLHDYKANRVNYFRKFRNVKAKRYFFLNST